MSMISKPTTVEDVLKAAVEIAMWILVIAAIAIGMQAFGQSSSHIITIIPNNTAVGEWRMKDLNTGNMLIIKPPDTVPSPVTWTWASTDALGCLTSDGAGQLAFGSCLAATVPLVLNSATNPAPESQLRVSANNNGMLSTIVYSINNAQIWFDAYYDGATADFVVPYSTSVARISKFDNILEFGVGSGYTAGVNSPTQPPIIMSIDGASFAVSAIGTLRSTGHPANPSFGQGIEIYYESGPAQGVLRSYDWTGIAWLGQMYKADYHEFETQGTSRWKVEQNGYLRPVLDRTYDIGAATLAAKNTFGQNVYGEAIKMAMFGSSFGSAWTWEADPFHGGFNVLYLFDPAGNTIMYVDAITLPRTFKFDGHVNPYARDTYDIGGPFPNEWRAGYFSRKVDATQGFTVGGVNFVDSTRSGNFVNLTVTGTCTGCSSTPANMMTTNTAQVVTGQKTFNGVNILAAGVSSIGQSGSAFFNGFFDSDVSTRGGFVMSKAAFGTGFKWAMDPFGVGVNLLSLLDPGGSIILTANAITSPRSFSFQGHVLPLTRDTYDIGGAFPSEWRNAYFNRTVFATTLQAITGSSLAVASDLFPDITNTYSLGSTSRRWLRLFAGGVTLNGQSFNTGEFRWQAGATLRVDAGVTTNYNGFSGFTGTKNMMNSAGGPCTMQFEYGWLVGGTC